MTRGLVNSSRFSPGNLSGEVLEQLFVGRADLMKQLLKRIHLSATREEKHYLLLVGPRGTGKTHFVSLAYHKIKNDAAYAQARERLKIAYLREEEWGVASFLDLLVRILRALVAEYGDAKLAAGIEQIYEDFKRSPATALQRAETLLIDYVGQDTLLLICENLEDLFEGLDDEGQKRWRAFIQEHPFWTILATTPTLFAGIQLQSSPFYNFFTVKHLERLDFDTALELLQQKALLDGRTKLADFLPTPTGRARVRAIHHLSGGNHRVYVIMYDFLDAESLEGLVSPFMRMADDLIPYYQDRLRQLAPQQRKIVEFLCQEARPVAVKDIATRCLISPSVAAKQLSELSKIRFVIGNKVGRESHYELAEPLMRVCVDIKDNRTEPFKVFVDFLRHWYTGRELRARGAVARARRLDPSDPESALAEVEVLAGTVGLGAALEALKSLLANWPEHMERDMLVDTLSRTLQLESQLRGAVAMARQVSKLRELLERHQQADLLPQVLTEALRAWLPGEGLASAEWPLALPSLQQALGGQPGCHLPLALLSVAVRHKHTGDESTLLELPLEQRTLLLEGMGAASEQGGEEADAE
jgi:hypothetical protein